VLELASDRVGKKFWRWPKLPRRKVSMPMTLLHQGSGCLGDLAVESFRLIKYRHRTQTRRGW
jgi:hypothetical protein